MHFDKEMVLEIAKHLQLKGEWDDRPGVFFIDVTDAATSTAPQYKAWNPLKKHGDALALLFALRHIEIDVHEHGVSATFDKKGEELVYYEAEISPTQDYISSFCRAITTTFYYHICALNKHKT